jgi:LysR substrate binding domain
MILSVPRHGYLSFAIRDELQSGALVVIPVPHWKMRKTMSIIRFRDAALTPSAQQFLNLLRTRWAGDETR